LHPAGQRPGRLRRQRHRLHRPEPAQPRTLRLLPAGPAGAQFPEERRRCGRRRGTLQSRRRTETGSPRMNITLLSFYILVWPALAMGVLVLLCAALIRDIRAARRKGTGLV